MSDKTIDQYRKIAHGDYPGAPQSRDLEGQAMGPSPELEVTAAAQGMISSLVRQNLDRALEIGQLIEQGNRVRDKLADLETGAYYAGYGAARIAYERARQINQEGHVVINDLNNYEAGTLVRAARSYLIAATDQADGIGAHNLPAPPSWPWDEKHWKPSPDYVRNLEKAGALIAAEIDRQQAADARIDLSKTAEAEKVWPEGTADHPGQLKGNDATARSEL